MVIDLHEKIPELLNAVTEATEENAMSINKLFLLMLENKHVIRASRDTLKKIRDFKFLNKANKDLITFILNHYVNTYSSLPPISKTILIVPSKDYNTKNDNEYCIVLKDAYNLDGGGSSVMIFNGKIINKPTSNGEDIRERSSSDIVYIGY